MNLSSWVEVWQQAPHTTVDASLPLKSDSTAVVGASEAGSAESCDAATLACAAVWCGSLM